MQLIAKAHALQRLFCLFCSFLPVHTGYCQRQLHIGQHRLVRDKVVALENKANGMVSVRVPVPVGIGAGGHAVDYQITGIIAVKAANHIQKRGFAAARRAQNGHKLTIAQIEAYGIQRPLS